MTTLNPQIVIPQAQNRLINLTEQYCEDRLYGTSTCSMNLLGLVSIALLIAGATNTCNNATQQQMECFLNNLNSQKC